MKFIQVVASIDNGTILIFVMMTIEIVMMTNRSVMTTNLFVMMINILS